MPPAAQAAFGAIQGPLVVPGTYTVKMTKGDEVYTTELKVVEDPRTKYTMAERQAQFDLTMKLYNMLDHMSWAVDSIIGIRDAANRARRQAAGKRSSAPASHRSLPLRPTRSVPRLSPPRKAAPSPAKNGFANS